MVDGGACLFLFAERIAGMPLQAYVIEAWPEHTGSALAATRFLRSVAAFGLPLCATSMYGALGYGWGNSVLALAEMGSGGACAPLSVQGRGEVAGESWGELLLIMSDGLQGFSHRGKSLTHLGIKATLKPANLVSLASIGRLDALLAPGKTNQSDDQSF